MPSVRVTVHRSTEPLSVFTNRAIREALKEAADVGAHVAEQVASQREGQTGQMQQITVSDVRGSVTGWEVEVISPAPWAWFQEFGTLGNRTRRLKQSARSTTPSGRQPPSREAGTGITPLRFLGAGATASRRVFLDLLTRKFR